MKKILPHKMHSWKREDLPEALGTLRNAGTMFSEPLLYNTEAMMWQRGDGRACDKCQAFHIPEDKV